MTVPAVSPAISRCLERINQLVAREIHGGTIRILAVRPGDRIALAALIDGTPVGLNFLYPEECEEAFRRDPASCSAIDLFARNWIHVLQVKMKDERSMREISRHAYDALGRPATIDNAD